MNIVLYLFYNLRQFIIISKLHMSILHHMYAQAKYNLHGKM